MLGLENSLGQYVDFIELKEDELIYDKRKNIPSIMGSSSFRKKVLDMTKK